MNAERVKMLWLRHLTGDRLARADEEILNDALLKDELLGQEVLADERMDGRLRQMGRSAADPEIFMRRLLNAIANEQDGAACVQKIVERVRNDGGRKPASRKLAKAKARKAPLKSKPVRHLAILWLAAACVLCVAALLVVRYLPSGDGALDVAVVSTSSPDAELLRDGKTKSVGTGVQLRAQDVLRVKSGHLQFTYQDGTAVTLHAESSVALRTDGGASTGGKQILVQSGEVNAEVAKQPSDNPMRVFTPHSETTVVGTRLSVSVAANSTRVSVEHGVVRVAAVEAGRTGPSSYVPAGYCAVAATGIGLKKFVLLPCDSACPVIYMNDDVDGGYTDEYVMALASAGSIQLKGTITTNGANSQHAKRLELVKLARASGMGNLPDPIPGAPAPLKRPESGRIEDTRPMNGTAARMIVAEARQATAQHPLVVLSGGALTDVADAYLQDPGIAERIVVAGVGSSDRDMADNGQIDPWAAYIVLEKFSYVQVAGYNSFAVPEARLTKLPPSALKDAMQWKVSSQNPFRRRTMLLHGADGGDGQTVVMLLRPEFALEARRVSFAQFVHGLPTFKNDPDGRALVITKADAAVATEEFWRAMNNAAAYGHTAPK